MGFQHFHGGKPVWTHDCESCKFRGAILPEGKNEPMDVYTHNDTLIVRFADDGADYFGLPIDIVEDMYRRHPTTNDSLVAALKLIKESV